MANEMDLYSRGLVTYDNSGNPTYAPQSQIDSMANSQFNFAQNLPHMRTAGSSAVDPQNFSGSQYLQDRYGSAVTNALKKSQQDYMASGGVQSWNSADPMNTSYASGDQNYLQKVLLPALQSAGLGNDSQGQQYLQMLQGGYQNSADVDAANRAALDADFQKKVMMGLMVTGGVMGAGALGAFGGGGALGAEAGATGAGADWMSQLAQYGGLESLGGMNASELASLGITPESLGLAGTGMQGIDSSYFSDFGSNFGPTGEGMFPTGSESFPGAWSGNVGGGGGIMDQLKNLFNQVPGGGSNILKSLLGGAGGGNGAGGTGGGMNGISDLLNSILGYNRAGDQSEYLKGIMERGIGIADPYQRHREADGNLLQASYNDPLSIFQGSGYQALDKRLQDTMLARDAAGGNLFNAPERLAQREAGFMDYNKDLQKNLIASSGAGFNPASTAAFMASMAPHIMGQEDKQSAAVGYGVNAGGNVLGNILGGILGGGGGGGSPGTQSGSNNLGSLFNWFSSSPSTSGSTNWWDSLSTGTNV